MSNLPLGLPGRDNLGIQIPDEPLARLLTILRNTGIENLKLTVGEGKIEWQGTEQSKTTTVEGMPEGETKRLMVAVTIAGEAWPLTLTPSATSFTVKGYRLGLGAIAVGTKTTFFFLAVSF